MNEIEIKLQLSQAAADRVEGLELLGHAQPAVDQRSVYFDTPDRSLAGSGISLRIRQLPDRRIQTIKGPAQSAAGLFERPEWEKLVENDVPIIDNTTPVQALLGEDVHDLARVFTVEVTRRTWHVTEGSSAIEVVLDKGQVRAGDRSSDVCEVELELNSGSPADLFAFARKIGDAVPVRVGILTKAERGYLLAEALRSSVKAEPIVLSVDMTAAEAFQQIAFGCLRQFRLNEDLLVSLRSAEPLHQARVALRRLRSAFSIFKPILGADAAQDLRGRLRQLGAELGSARDLDVLLHRAQPGPLHDRLRAEREAAYDRVEAVLEEPSSRTLMLDLVEWLSTGPWLSDPATEEARQQPAADFAADSLARFRRKVKKGGREISKVDDETRHEVRKDAKKLRYAAAFFAPLFDHHTSASEQKAFTKALEEVQEQLGSLNDLATAPQVLERLGLADDPAASSLLAPGRKKRLLAAASDAIEDLLDAPRYWR